MHQIIDSRQSMDPYRTFSPSQNCSLESPTWRSQWTAVQTFWVRTDDFSRMSRSPVPGIAAKCIMTNQMEWWVISRRWSRSIEGKRTLISFALELPPSANSKFSKIKSFEINLKDKKLPEPLRALVWQCFGSILIQNFFEMPGACSIKPEVVFQLAAWSMCRFSTLSLKLEFY